MKTLCIVCDGHWDQLQGGAEYQLDLLGRALADLGYQVHYLFLDRETPVQDSSMILHRLSLSEIKRKIFYPYHLLLALQIFRTLDRVGPDIVINRVGSALTGICAFYGRLRGVRTIWHVANITDLIDAPLKKDRTLLMSWLDRKILDYGIRNTKCIVAQAAYQDELLRRRFKRSADLIVPNFHHAEKETIEKAGPLTILWVANIKPKKQPEYFIRLAREFINDTELRFLMVGRADGGGYQKKIEALISEAPNLEYLGELPIERVNQLMREASIFVNTSVFEGFPNTFIQAWLRKVPVVSLQFDPDSVLVSNKLGFHSGDFDQMVRDVRRLVANDNLRKDIGTRAQKYAEVEHGLRNGLSKFVDLIENQ